MGGGGAGPVRPPPRTGEAVPRAMAERSWPGATWTSRYPLRRVYLGPVGPGDPRPGGERESRSWIARARSAGPAGPRRRASPAVRPPDGRLRRGLLRLPLDEGLRRRHVRPVRAGGRHSPVVGAAYRRRSSSRRAARRDGLLQGSWSRSLAGDVPAAARYRDRRRPGLSRRRPAEGAPPSVRRGAAAAAAPACTLAGARVHPSHILARAVALGGSRCPSECRSCGSGSRPLHDSGRAEAWERARQRQGSPMRGARDRRDAPGWTRAGQDRTGASRQRPRQAGRCDWHRAAGSRPLRPGRCSTWSASIAARSPWIRHKRAGSPRVEARRLDVAPHQAGLIGGCHRGGQGADPAGRRSREGRREDLRIARDEGPVSGCRSHDPAGTRSDGTVVASRQDRARLAVHESAPLARARSQAGADVADRVPRLLQDDHPAAVVDGRDVSRAPTESPDRVGSSTKRVRPTVLRQPEQKLLDRDMAGIARRGLGIARQAERTRAD